MAIDKVRGDSSLSWEEIADLSGLGIHPDTLRKGCLALKWADEAGMLHTEPVPMTGMVDCGSAMTHEAADMMNDARGIMEDAQMLLWQARDERNAMNAQRRVEARKERNLEILQQKLEEIGRKRYPGWVKYDQLREQSEAELVIMLNDVHYGSMLYRPGGEYNRMQTYVMEIAKIAKRHNAHDASVFLMGDLISGMIHRSIQVTNRENVIAQVMGAAEMITDFLHELNGIFDHVKVYSVPGNHSRIDKKDDALIDDRLDDLVWWYANGVLQKREGIEFVESNPTMCSAGVHKGMHRVIAVHGDYDDFTDAGCAKLVSYLGYSPTAILYAHKHTAAMREYNGVVQIQSGAMCGSGDDFTNRLRLKGIPSQSIAVMGDKGVEAVYNVKLS